VPPGRRPGIPLKSKVAAKETDSQDDKDKAPEGKVGENSTDKGTDDKDKAPGKAGNGDSKPTATKTSMVTKTSLGEGVMVTHTGLLRMKYRKRNLIYVLITIAVLLSLIPIYYGVRWVKTNMSRSGRKAPAATTTEKRPKKTTGSTAATQPVIEQWSPYDDEFRALKGKVRGLPCNSAEDIDVHIKVWQDFLDSHPDADPNDRCIRLASEQLKSMQDLRSMY
jgi:hypothetical protein